MRTKFSKNKVAIIGLASLMRVGGTSGILAYLTDSEVATNTFTIGNVTIEGIEPNYPGNDPETPPDPKDLVPNEEVAKDPLISNKGATDVIAFLTVDSPMEDITVLNDDGGEATAQSVNEIFWFKDANDRESTHANNFDNHWDELTTKEMYIVIAADGTEQKVGGLDTTQAALKTAYDAMPATSKLVKRYGFAYKTEVQGSDKTDGDPWSGQTPDKTEPVFDKVQLKNVQENQIDKATENIVVRFFAIQSGKIMEDNVDLSADLTTANLGKIFDIFVKQNSVDHDTTGNKITGIRDIDDVSSGSDGASGETTQHVNRWDTTDNVTAPGANVNPSHS